MACNVADQRSGPEPLGGGPGPMWCDSGCDELAFFRRGRATAHRRHGQLDDLAHDGAELLRQRTGVVRDAVASADLLHLPRDLGVAVRWHVREQVVLDLVRQVAGQDVEELATGQVRRTEDLAEVPHAV